MRLCDGASDHPSPHGRGFGTPFRDPDISDQPGAPEHPRRNPHLGDRDPPAGRPSGAHRHGNAFVYAYVLEGAVRSQLEDEPMRTYHQGENWIEQPGAHHVATEDASNTESAELLLVVFVVVALRDHPRTVVTDPHASYVGTELGERTVLPGANAILGEIRYSNRPG